MVDIVADLHLHSKYSRAVSPQMNLSLMAHVGKQKGLDVLATGDWTHPLWLKELEKQLVESEEGLYRIKNQELRIKHKKDNKIRFLLSVEIATIFSQGGKGRRVHNLVFVPSFATAEKVNKELLKRGCNLSSDGRPIIGLSSKHLLETLLEIDERSLLIPAHVWTPWFGIYGQMSGFTSLSEAFEDLAPYVYGIETGLSSDPEMSWQIDELNTRSILSFSDAHSAPKMGREATVFQLESLSYENIRKAIMAPMIRHSGLSRISKQLDSGVTSVPQNDDINKVLYTVEFYPEEGKYHYSGHRKCGIIYTPEDTQTKGDMCPVCHRKLTDGVMRRVQELSRENPRGQHGANKQGIVWISDPSKKHPPFVRLVPLQEIIAEAMKRPVASVKVKALFDVLTTELQSELTVLLHAEIATIANVASLASSPQVGAKVAEGVQKVREAQIVIEPGYDGVYGTVKIWASSAEATEGLKNEENKSQIQMEF